MQCSAFTLSNKRCKNVSKYHLCHLHCQKYGDCTICLKTISRPEILHCGHFFHKACIDKWKKTNKTNNRPFTCPICREHIQYEFSNEFQLQLKKYLKHSDIFDVILDVACNFRFSFQRFSERICEIFSF